MSWIQTYTGKQFDLVNPDPTLVDIEDIAHALAMTCRFGGHTEKFYSVAEHSLVVSANVDPEHAFLALLHDAAEAYIGDLVRPFKLLLCPQVNEIESRIMAAILARYEVEPDEVALEAVKVADDRALATELRDLFPKTCHWSAAMGLREPFAKTVYAMGDSGRAEYSFLRRFRMLRALHNKSRKQPVSVSQENA